MEAEISEQSVVRLTETAASQVKTMLAEQPENAGKTLRVYVEKGGCSGQQYGLIFDERRDHDIVAEFFGATLLVDPYSAKFLAGSVVDFNDDLNAHGFKLTNPQAKQTCGCGRSFET